VRDETRRRRRHVAKKRLAILFDRFYNQREKEGRKQTEERNNEKGEEIKKVKLKGEARDSNERYRAEEVRG
jgi:hypothetical protein